MDSISLAASMLKAYYGANETKLAFNKQKVAPCKPKRFQKGALEKWTDNDKYNTKQKK